MHRFNTMDRLYKCIRLACNMPYMVTLYPIWLYYTIYGRIIPYMVILCPIWSYYTLYGHIIPYLVINLPQYDKNINILQPENSLHNHI